MQNATIQINAMSGMGDIFCDIYIAVIIANAFKKEDCNTDLKFYWGPHPVDNKKIFDDTINQIGEIKNKLSFAEERWLAIQILNDEIKK